MKKTTVYASMKWLGTEVLPGWQTDVPGLALAKYNPGDKQNQERWFLWHKATGRFIRSFVKRDAGQVFAGYLGESEVDWESTRVMDDPHAYRAYIRALEQEGSG